MRESRWEAHQKVRFNSRRTQWLAHRLCRARQKRRNVRYSSLTELSDRAKRWPPAGMTWGEAGLGRQS
jgi:hypothetical protein